jgi:hypothetical protein
MPCHQSFVLPKEHIALPTKYMQSDDTELDVGHLLNTEMLEEWDVAIKDLKKRYIAAKYAGETSGTSKLNVAMENGFKNPGEKVITHWILARIINNQWYNDEVIDSHVGILRALCYDWGVDIHFASSCKSTKKESV